MQGETIRVASEIWAPTFTNTDSSGLYEDIVRHVYDNNELVFHYTPYSRSIYRVMHGHDDLWLGSYRGEVSEAIYPDHYFDVDEVSALHLRNTPIDINHSLHKLSFGWIRGYEYHRYYPQIPRANVYQLSSLDQGVRLLMAQRLSLLIDDKTVLSEYLEQHPQTASLVSITQFGLLPLYPGFRNTKRGRWLAHRWDEGLKRLKQDGRLRQLYQQHGVEYVLDLCDAHSSQSYGCLISPANSD